MAYKYNSHLDFTNKSIYKILLYIISYAKIQVQDIILYKLYSAVGHIQ